MTIDELAERMERGFDTIGNKMDAVTQTVAKHGVSLTGHDREIREVKDYSRELDERVAKVERFMWLTLGAGAAAGVGISKLFM